MKMIINKGTDADTRHPGRWPEGHRPRGTHGDRRRGTLAVGLCHQCATHRGPHSPPFHPRTRLDLNQHLSLYDQMLDTVMLPKVLPGGSDAVTEVSNTTAGR